MSVIINQLDIIVTPDPPQAGPPDSPVSAPTPPVPTALDLRHVMRHLGDRSERWSAD